MSCGVGCRRGLDPMLLWLWCRPEATAPIRSLAWEPPHAVGAALQKTKLNKIKRKEIMTYTTTWMKLKGIIINKPVTKRNTVGFHLQSSQNCRDVK